MEDITQPSAGDESVVSVLDAFASSGWSENHLTRDAAVIECGACGAANPAGPMAVEALHRVEGASDPDDLHMVIGMRCPECSAAGSILVGYGPNAGDVDAAVLVAIDLDGDPADPVASVD